MINFYHKENNENNKHYVYYGPGTKFIHLMLTKTLCGNFCYLLSHFLEDTKARKILDVLLMTINLSGGKAGYECSRLSFILSVCSVQTFLPITHNSL